MDLSCPVCYVEDKDGEWYQCDQGHPVCAACYWLDFDHPRHNGRRLTCVLCRDVLKPGKPVLCLERMQAIAAKKAAVAAKEAEVKREVEIAMQEHDELELAKAVSVAEAQEREEAAALEEKAEAQAIRWSCERAEQERALKRDQERAGLKAAHDLANANGGFDEQANLEAEYAAAAKRRKYTTKLQRQIAGAPNRVSECCTIIGELLMQLSPQERVLANATMAQAAAAASSSLVLSADNVAQARLFTDYSRKRSREIAASTSAIEMKQLVRRLLADGDINELTAKRVRLEIESALGLEAGELKPRKSEITACIDMVLNECASCQADLSGHPNQDELEDPNDLRKYCVPCWKAYALR